MVQKSVEIMKKGRKYYSGASGVVNRYEYLCVHPTAPNYHILMDCGKSEPIRMYKDDFNKLRPTERDAVQQAINSHESHIHSIKTVYAEILNNGQD